MQNIIVPTFFTLVAALVFITYLDLASGGRIFLWLMW